MLANDTMVAIVTEVSSASVVTLPLLFMLPLIPSLSVLSDCYSYASAPNVVQASDVSCVVLFPPPPPPKKVSRN